MTQTVEIESLQDLFRNGLYDSCFMIMGFIPTDTWSASHLLLFADVLVKKEQPLLALKYYERGLKLTNSSIEWVKLAHSRYIDCCLASKQFYKAKETLGRIDPDARSVKNWKQLAAVHDHFGELKSAVECYKTILRLQPKAMESVLALIKYGCSYKELKSLAGNEQMIVQFAITLDSAQNGQYAAAIESLKSLSPHTTIESMCYSAQIYHKQGDFCAAMEIYQKIRKMEPNWIDGMDQYAYLLQKQGNLAAVNRLHTDLFALSNNLPEPWVVLSISCLMKSDFDSGLNHIENAISIAPRHVFAYQVKGDLLYAMNRPGKACTAYRTAYRISREFANYEGLVHCYIQLGKLMDATSTAKEALFLYPQSAKAVCLAGIVMKENPSLVSKAKEYLEKALKIDPMLIEAVFALSDLYVRLEDLDKALEILNKGASMHHTDSIHVQLGVLFYKKHDYTQATMQFNAALGINPENAAAKKGLLDIEKAISGRDEDDEELESEGDLDIDAQSMEDDDPLV